MRRYSSSKSALMSELSKHWIHYGIDQHAKGTLGIGSPIYTQRENLCYSLRIAQVFCSQIATQSYCNHLVCVVQYM